MRFVFTYLIFGSVLNTSFAQTTSILSFSLVKNKQKLFLNETCVIAKDSVTPSKLIFYISKIECLKNSKVVFRPSQNYHLVDLENESKSKINLETKLVFDSIRFNIGVDSLANVSGAMDGCLDPINGMYWAWQSGYINFKFEGSSSRCKSKNKTFQFHIGGYLAPHKTLKTLTYPSSIKSSVELVIDLEKFLQHLDLSELSTIMSPGDKAVELSNHYTDFILIKK